MPKTALDRAYLFIDREMLKYASTLSVSKLKRDRYALAKAIYEITSSRFESPKHSVRIFRTFAPEPAYAPWERGGPAGALKQCIVLKAMLLATGEFTDGEIRILRINSPFFSAASGGHFYLKVKLGDRSVYQDPWARNWKVDYGERLVPGKAEPFEPPLVKGEYNSRHETKNVTLYILGRQNSA